MKLNFFVVLALLVIPYSGVAQISTQSPGGTLTRGLTLQTPLDQTGAGIVRDAVGRPCLDIEAAARPQVVDPQMLDHVVSLKNNCPKLIKVKLCYFNSDRCREVELQAYQRVDTILGTMRGVQFFRYSIVQK